MAACAFIVVAVQSQPPDARCGMQLPEGSLVMRVRKGRNADLFHRLDLRAADRMGTVGEAVKWAVAACLPQLRSSLIPRELISGLRDGLYGLRCHCGSLAEIVTGDICERI